MDAYVALDLETTGLNPARDRILEIGAVKYRNGQEREVFSVLVNPQRKLPALITELTGITDAMAQSGISGGEAVRQLLEFCEELPLLGHNILFDYSFVKRAAVNQFQTFEKTGIDTLKIARQLLPELEHRSLEYLCGYYGIGKESRHRAVSDARAAAVLYDRMRQQFPECDRELFEPKPLVYAVKRQGPITARQKVYLNDLLKYHKIEIMVQPDSLTKNEASRMIDKIILEYGKIGSRAGGSK